MLFPEFHRRAAGPLSQSDQLALFLLNHVTVVYRAAEGSVIDREEFLSQILFIKVFDFLLSVITQLFLAQTIPTYPKYSV